MPEGKLTKSQVRSVVHRMVANLAEGNSVNDNQKLGPEGIVFDLIAIDNLRGDLNLFLDRYGGGHIGDDVLSESTTVSEVVDLVASQLDL